MNIKTLYGHISPETAFVVEDYPFGFRLRCKIRYWIEHKKGKGFRFCHQTTDPRRGNVTWNKPKYSTYSDFMILTQEIDTGHIKHLTAGPYFEDKARLENLKQLDLSGTVYQYVSVKTGETKNRTALELLTYLVARAESINQQLSDLNIRWTIKESAPIQVTGV